MFNDVIVKPEQIQLIINPYSITIGKNIIPIPAYEKHKQEFLRIIQSGDVAWNERFSIIELNEFIKKLELNKVKLENNLIPLNRECKGREIMDMKELAKQEEIKNSLDNIPVGMTKLLANSIDIEPTEVEFNGVKKTRYDLKAKTLDGKEVHFGCGVQIYNGLIAASKVPGVKTIYITRNGTTKDDTKYTVVGE